MAAPRRTREHFLHLERVAAGMTLSTPASVAERGVLTMELPAGHILTEENLDQLRAHHAEYVFVHLPDPRGDEQVAVDAAQAARRVLDIFQGADLTNPHMAAFFDQVLRYRSL